MDSSQQIDVPFTVNGESISHGIEQTTMTLSNENSVTAEPAAFTIYGATRSTRPGDGTTTATPSISSTGDESIGISSDASVPENYLSKFRKIVSPATGMIIAGHAQNVANSVVVVAKNAVSTVGATKSAIMNRQESRAKQTCSKCGMVDHVATIVTSLASRLERCQVCGVVLCPACYKKSSFPLSEETVHQEMTPGKKTYFLCRNNPCNGKVSAMLLRNFQLTMREKYDTFYTIYFQNQEIQSFFYSMPGSGEDTMSRRALRFAQVAEVVLEQIATATGFSLTFKAFKYAYYGRELMNIIINDDVLSALGPVFEALNHFGIKGPSGLLAVYYLACSNDLRRKIDPLNESRGYRPGNIGVVSTPCSPNILKYISSFVSPAQWLYLAKLPTPHDSGEWSSWFLSRLILRQGWTLLVSINDATKLPDGSKCPAFALVVRNRKASKKDDVVKSDTNGEDKKEKKGDNKGENKGEKSDEKSGKKSVDDDNHSKPNVENRGACRKGTRECLLVIRGSASSMDWSINMDDVSVPFSFKNGSLKIPTESEKEKISMKEKTYEDKIKGNTFERKEKGDENSMGSVKKGTSDRGTIVAGSVHAGMHRGALGILDGYGMRGYILDLASKGYDIKIVGHSLGAGTAAILAAELKNNFMHISETAERILYPMRFTPNTEIPAKEENDYVTVSKNGNEREGVIGSIGGQSVISHDTETQGVEKHQHENREKDEYEDKSDIKTIPSTSHSPCLPLLSSILRGITPRISAVGFATPPCVCEPLATAFGQGNPPLIISVILGEDPIPRFSRANVIALAGAAKRFLPTAESWKRQDMEDLRKYALSYGKASTPNIPEGEREGEGEGEGDEEGEGEGNATVGDDIQEGSNHSSYSNSSNNDNNHNNHSSSNSSAHGTNSIGDNDACNNSNINLFTDTNKNELKNSNPTVMQNNNTFTIIENVNENENEVKNVRVSVLGPDSKTVKGEVPTVKGTYKTVHAVQTVHAVPGAVKPSVLSFSKGLIAPFSTSIFKRNDPTSTTTSTTTTTSTATITTTATATSSSTPLPHSIPAISITTSTSTSTSHLPTFTVTPLSSSHPSASVSSTANTSSPPLSTPPNTAMQNVFSVAATFYSRSVSAVQTAGHNTLGGEMWHAQTDKADKVDSDDISVKNNNTDTHEDRKNNLEVSDLTQLKVTNILESDIQGPHIEKENKIEKKEKEENNEKNKKEGGSTASTSSEQKTNSIPDSTSFSTSVASTLVMVPPGRIVHIYKKKGRYTSSEITHEHPTLRRIVPYVEIGVDDHLLPAYRRGLKAILTTHSTTPSTHNSSQRTSRGTPHNARSTYNKSLSLSLQCEGIMSSSETNRKEGSNSGKEKGCVADSVDHLISNKKEKNAICCEGEEEVEKEVEKEVEEEEWDGEIDDSDDSDDNGDEEREGDKEGKEEGEKEGDGEGEGEGARKESRKKQENYSMWDSMSGFQSIASSGSKVEVEVEEDGNDCGSLSQADVSTLLENGENSQHGNQIVRIEDYENENVNKDENKDKNENEKENQDENQNEIKCVAPIHQYNTIPPVDVRVHVDTIQSPSFFSSPTSSSFYTLSPSTIESELETPVKSEESDTNSAPTYTSTTLPPPPSSSLLSSPSLPPSLPLPLPLPWVPCCLCGLDCTWAYIMHSDASRALVTHRCNLCGKVVCTVCSPSGDKIPGDGINRSTQLKDLRMILPQSGDLGPKRVCLHCYLDN